MINPEFWASIDPLEIWEFLAMTTGILSVWLGTRNNILVYPIGIVSTSIYTFIYYLQPLYAFGTLNIYFTILSVAGWYNWSRVKDDAPVFPISYCSPRENILGAVFLVVTSVLTIALLVQIGESLAVPDAISSGLQVLAMWWMTRRKIENWIAWILANIVAIPACIESELYYTAFQYFVFIGLAISGYIQWKKIMHREAESPRPDTDSPV